MVNDNMIAVSIARIARHRDCAICCCINGSSLWCGKIETCMKLYSFIDRVNAVTKPGSNTGKIFITYGLDGRSATEKLLFIFQKVVNFRIRFFLRSYIMTQTIE